MQLSALKDFVSGNIFSGDAAVICKIDQTLQPFPGIQGLRMAEAAVIQDQRIKLIVFRESSDFSEKGSSTHSSHIKGFFQ